MAEFARRAAHAIHPIAGQGLNLGFRDAMALADLLIEASQRGENLGAIDLLRQYQRRRRPDDLLMLAATDALDRLFMRQAMGAPLFSRGAHRRQELVDIVPQRLGLPR